MLHRKKGATLAEICVVLAVVSIISLMVVSFVTMTSGRTTASTAKLNAMEELELVESLVDNWFDAMTKNGEMVENQDGEWVESSITVNSDRLVGWPDGYICVEYDKILMLLPGQENPTVYPLKTVRGLRFSSETREDVYGNVVDTLYFCTAEYTYSANGREITQYYTFCVNPRVGEVIAPPKV